MLKMLCRWEIFESLSADSILYREVSYNNCLIGILVFFFGLSQVKCKDKEKTRQYLFGVCETYNINISSKELLNRL